MPTRIAPSQPRPAGACLPPVTSTYTLMAATHAAKSITIGSKKVMLRMSTTAVAKPLRDVQRGQPDRRMMFDVASVKTPATLDA